MVYRGFASPFRVRKQTSSGITRVRLLGIAPNGFKASTRKVAHASGSASGMLVQCPQTMIVSLHAVRALDAMASIPPDSSHPFLIGGTFTLTRDTCHCATGYLHPGKRPW